jgi:hypothetical protein
LLLQKSAYTQQQPAGCVAVWLFALEFLLGCMLVVAFSASSNQAALTLGAP